jgi:hypothetical protein
MVHIEVPEESVHGHELRQQTRDDFLGAEMQHETVMGVALGQIDPISLKPFPDDENERTVV